MNVNFATRFFVYLMSNQKTVSFCAFLHSLSPAVFSPKDTTQKTLQMIRPEIPGNEKERLKALLSYDILDTLQDIAFDEITKIASEICQTPISLVSLIDNNRQWFKSHYGITATETPREYAFCAHAILEPEKVLMVNDATKDERFHDNPLVTNEPHVVFYAGAPLVTSDGFALGTLCVIDDQPKSLTNKQKEALKALANQVMAQLELRKKIQLLKKSQEALKESNESLERFARVASHDLKSPLATIQQVSEILSENYAPKLDTLGAEMIGYLERSAKSLRCLVDGILSHSSSIDLNIKEQEEFASREVFEHIIDLLSPPKEINIIIAGAFPQLKLNKACFHQIFQNLIGNAIKYNDSPQPEIRVECKSVDNRWEFTVHDNGPGIPEKYQQSIFELFQTLGQKDRFGEKGTGIGLATVKKLVDKLDGEIQLDSHKENGTCFKVCLTKAIC